MIEVQIPDNEELYNELRGLSSYHSDRTHVLNLDDRYRTRVPSCYSISQTLDDDRHHLDYSKKSGFTITPMDDTYRCYLELFTPFGNSVSINETELIYYLIKSNLVYLDSGFSSSFYRLDRGAKVGALNTSKKRYNTSNGRFKPETISDISLSKLFYNVKVTETGKFSRKINIISSTRSTDVKGRERVELYYQYIGDDGELHDGNSMIYSCVNNNYTLTSGVKSVNALFNKNGGVIKFLPDGLDISNMVLYSQSVESKRIAKMPVAIFRIMLYEYLIRSEI